MEQFNDICRDIICQEWYLKAFPKIYHQVVQVEGIFYVLILLIGMLRFRYNLLDSCAIKSSVENFIAFGF